MIIKGKEKMKEKGAICGGNKERTLKWIRKAKSKKEFIKRLEIGFMAIM